MVLRLYDTMTRRKVDFAPLDPERVRMYVCGPTVYDRAHIGNARPVIVFDVLFRLLRHLYGADRVAYARNITDVDDKIIVRAAERGISIRDLTEETAKGFAEDVAALGCLPPTVEPRATEHIPDMIAVVEKLLARGHAYEAQGHVLFDVPSMPAYGRLSHRSLDEMIAGARVEVAPYKRAETDFVLWKPAAPDEPGWDSPWGRGRPGWHLECSAMSWRHLGETFDIHGGGIDLVFPHHENEVAQSCCAFDRPAMAQVWMHNGFLQVEGRKMAKSTGNFATIHDLVATDSFGGRRWPGEVLRLAMLRTHYRQPIDWTEASLLESDALVEQWMNAIGDLELPLQAEAPDPAFIAALCDDLNSPQALAIANEIAAKASFDLDAAQRLFNIMHFLSLDTRLDQAREAWLRISMSIHDYGKYNYAFQDYVRAGENIQSERKVRERLSIADIHRLHSAGITSDLINTSIENRLTARKAKDWAASDRIRDELAAMGVVLKDNKDGTTSWTVGRTGGT